MVGRRVLGVLVIGTLLGACGGGGGGGGTGGGGTGGGTQPTPFLQRIDIGGVPGTWTVGQTQQLTATAVFSNGTTQSITATATWTSTNSSVASVNSAGFVNVLTSGSTTIRAASQGITSSDVNVQVSPPQASTFTLSGMIRTGSATPIVGATVRILDGVNVDKTATTDAGGIYRLLSLLPGTFRVRATATGFDVFEFNATISNADVRNDFSLTPSTTPSAGPTANAGGPYLIQHDRDVVFDGTRSTGTGLSYAWNCGQPGQPGCDKTGARPTFRYRRCVNVAGSTLPCRAGSTTVADYTVRLTVTDSSGRTHSATTTVTVTNSY